MELLVIVILLTVTGAQESQLKGPENTLSVVGSNVTLKCLSPSSNCNGTEWLKYNDGNLITIFNQHGIISNAYSERYSVDNKSGCDLIIRNVQLTDAGRFLCRALISSSTVEKTAYLIILKTQPKCTVNVSLDNILERDGVQLTCEVTHNGTSRTSMVWLGVEDAAAAVENRNTISRSYSVVAYAPEVPSFTCATSFAFETTNTYGEPILGLAKNNISEANCATSAIRVLYSVRDIQLSPSLSNYPPGTVITCTAKGYPSPNFKWQEMENNGVWVDIQNQKSSEFSTTIVSSKRYRCVAMNVVTGTIYIATSHEFQVNNTDDNGSVTDVTTTVTTLLLLLVAVFVGVGFLLLTILLVICFCVRSCPGYKCCHSEKKSKAKISRGEQPLRENPDIYVNVNQVGEQESAYASLGAQRDANEYMSLELR